MQYIALVYQDPNGLDQVSDRDLDETMTRCGEWCCDLDKQGKHVFSAGLQSPKNAVTVKKRNGKLTTTDGPFAETKEVLGGFTIFEARDLNEALQIVSRFPGAEWGSVEIRPVFDPHGDVTDPRDKRIKDSILRTASEEEAAVHDRARASVAR